MQTSATSIQQKPAWRRTLDTNGVFLLWTAFLLIFPFLVGAISGTNPTGRRGESVFQQGVMIEYLTYAMLAMSYNLIFGFTGVISFGHALFFGAGGYILGGAARALGGETGVIVGVVLAIVASTGLGLLIGIVSLRLKGVYYAMFTLAVAEMFYIFFRRNPETGSEDGFGLGSSLPEFLGQRIVLFYLTVILFILMFLFIRRLLFSPTGAVLLGIRENENRAKTVGYNTLRYKLFAITLAGVLATITGMLYALLNRKVGPEMFFVNFTVNPLLHTIVGGIGTFIGPILGAVGLSWLERTIRSTVITVGENQINIGQWWAIILGVIFVAVVLIFPYGVVGTWNRAAPHIRKWISRFLPGRNAESG